MPRLETPTLARIPASVIVAKRAPSTAADQTTQRSGRIGVPVPVLRQPRPSGALAAADGRALGEREQLGAPVERRDQLGLDAGAQRERLELGGERRVPALGALEHARAEAPHVVARVAAVREQRQVGVEAERGARGERRPGRAPALARIGRVRAQRRERASRPAPPCGAAYGAVKWHTRRVPLAARR